MAEVVESLVLDSGGELRLDAEIQQREAEKLAEEPKQEETVEDTATPQAAEEAPPQKQYYTEEEMKQLDTDKIDTSRIPPEMMPFYKAMLAPVTRKSQQLSEGLAQLQQYQQQQQMMSQMLQQQAAQSQQSQQFDLMKLHAQNPKAAYDWLDREYLEHYETDPTRAQHAVAVKSALIQRQLEAWQNWQAQQYQEQQKAVQETQAFNATAQAIKQQVPEWSEQLANELRTFAIERLGYTEQQIHYLFDPRVTPPDVAAANVKVAYQFYQADKAESELKGKRTRRPMQVEKAGSGFKQEEQNKWGADDYFSMRGNKTIT